MEPSRFRTGFNDGDVLRVASANPDYDSVTGAIRTDMAGAMGTQEGDPVRAAEVIRRVLDSPDAPLRLPVGAEAVRRISDSYRKNLAAVEQWAEVSAQADFPDAPASVRPV